MATVFTHAFVAVAAGAACYGRRAPGRLWPVAIACSVGPDLDVVGFSFGIEYGDHWGHRGMTHSLLFALVVAVVVVSWLLRSRAPPLGPDWWRHVAFFFAVTASHGVIDAFTDGGLGIAFFSPFDTGRYFMPWRPLAVPWIGGLETLLNADGWRVVRSELVWVWLPVGLVAAGVVGARAFRRSGA